MKRIGSDCIASYLEGNKALQVTVQVGRGYNDIDCLLEYIGRETCTDL